jgi:hypothetical protein
MLLLLVIIVGWCAFLLLLVLALRLSAAARASESRLGSPSQTPLAASSTPAREPAIAPHRELTAPDPHRVVG